MIEELKIKYALISLLIVGIIVLIYIFNKKRKHGKKYSISFKEALDLTELPVITFMCGDKKLNFLLDTGSNKSFINQSILHEIEYVELQGGQKVTGAGGKQFHSTFGQMKLTYKDQIFDTPVNIMDLSAGFDEIKKESGVQIHGILGSAFFQKYKYVLDFDSLIAYIK